MSNVFGSAGTGFVNLLLKIFTSKEYRTSLQSLVADGIEYRLISDALIHDNSTAVIVSFPTDEAIRSDIILAVEALNHQNVVVQSFTRGNNDA